MAVCACVCGVLSVEREREVLRAYAGKRACAVCVVLELWLYRLPLSVERESCESIRRGIARVLCDVWGVRGVVAVHSQR